jgi:hypothetical protein
MAGRGAWAEDRGLGVVPLGRPWQAVSFGTDVGPTFATGRPPLRR